jgi:hypothetical protein
MHSPPRLNGAWADARATAWAETVPASRDLIIWGAHGGAGASTLATLLQPARDMGALRTEADYRYPSPTRTRTRSWSPAAAPLGRRSKHQPRSRR